MHHILRENYLTLSYFQNNWSIGQLSNEKFEICNEPLTKNVCNFQIFHFVYDLLWFSQIFFNISCNISIGQIVSFLKWYIGPKYLKNCQFGKTFCDRSLRKCHQIQPFLHISTLPNVLKNFSKIKTKHHISICHTILESSIPGPFADISFESKEVCQIMQK